MDGMLFRTCLVRRLRLRMFETEGWCPFCGEVMDVWGDHALVCATKGDRTVRHNRIRDSVLDEGRKAGLELDKEKANLLPGRPDEDGILTKEQTGSTGRRPADIWWGGGAGGRM